MKKRKAQAWVALRKLGNIRKSDLSRKLKINFFRSTVESILLYGAVSRIMTKTMNSEIDGTYTRLLLHALNINWRENITNMDLYGDLPKISSVMNAIKTWGLYRNGRWPDTVSADNKGHIRETLASKPESRYAERL